MTKILKVSQLGKSYKSGNNELTVLSSISFEVSPGATFSIVGPSGSGKTTLLGLCAGLDNASIGTVELCGAALEKLNEDERASLRNKEVGFIFQDFQLLPTLSALENVSVPLELQGAKDAQKIAADIILPNYRVVNSSGSLLQGLSLQVHPFCLPMNPQGIWTKKRAKK
jgi:putative ABC transport system ATP-binding protein